MTIQFECRRLRAVLVSGSLTIASTLPRSKEPVPLRFLILWLRLEDSAWMLGAMLREIWPFKCLQGWFVRVKTRTFKAANVCYKGQGIYCHFRQAKCLLDGMDAVGLENTMKLLACVFSIGMQIWGTNLEGNSAWLLWLWFGMLWLLSLVLLDAGSQASLGDSL